MATTIIDTLILELGLDPAKFKKGKNETVDEMRKLEDELRKRAAAGEKSVGGIEQAFSSLQKRMLGIAGLMLGGLGIQQLVERITKANVAVSNLSTTFSLNAQKMESWGKVGERFGFSRDSIKQGFAAIQTQRFNLQNYGEASPLIALSRATQMNGRNPLNVQGRNGQLLDPEQLALNISKWLSKEKDQGAAINALTRAGLPQEFATLLAQGPDKLKSVLQEAKKLAPSDKDIQNFRELNDAFENASQHAVRLAEVISSMFAPMLTQAFKDSAENIKGILETIKLLQEGKYGDVVGRLLTPNKDAQDVMRAGTAAKLRADIKRKEEQLATTEGQIGGAKGIYAEGLRKERDALIDELKKLRQQLEKVNTGATLQNQSFGGGGFGGARVMPASYSPGGGGAGLSIPGGGGGGGGGQIRSPGGSVDLYKPLPDVPGGVIDRGRFAEELKNKPWLRDKIMGIAAGENLDPKANISVLESMMNRAAMAGTSLEAQAKLYHGEGGYYAGYNPGALRNPRIRSMIEKSLSTALGGSNVSNYATDNASSWLAQKNKATGRFRLQSEYGGESFFSPGTAGGRGGPRSRDAYEAWRNRMSEDAKRKMIEGGTPLPTPDPRKSFDVTDLLRSSQFAALGGPGTAGPGGSSSTTIGGIHIHTDRKTSDGIASTIQPAIRRFAQIAAANNGPA